MKIVIVGAGKLGSALAKNFLKQGANVKIIDSDKKECIKLANSLDVTVFCADGTRAESLDMADIDNCDAFISATSKDEDNLVSCEIAKRRFNAKKTIAKCNNASSANLMKKLGVDIVFEEANIITQMLSKEIHPLSVELVADVFGSDADISQYVIKNHWSKEGSLIKELKIPEGCVLVYIKRGDDILIPRGNTAIFSGDKVVALCLSDAKEKLLKLFEIEEE